MIDAPFTPIRKSFVEPCPAWGIDSGSQDVFIRCGGCQKCVNLSEGHTIREDGTVHPSVHHDEGDRCQWHVYIRLLDWQTHKPTKP